MLRLLSTRLRLAAALLCVPLGIGLLAAGPSLAPPQTLVVYPFRTGEGLDSTAGADFATKLADAINRGGGVLAKPGPAGTLPAGYLKAAVDGDGDFYLTGYATPLATSVTVVEQLVSTRSGSIVWSNSAQVSTPDDLETQANTVRNAIISYASRGYLMVGAERSTPPPAPEHKPKSVSVGANGGSNPATAYASPLPIPKDAGVDNLGLGFPNGPQPEPKHYASAASPTRFAIVSVGGHSSDDARSFAESSIVGSLTKHGQTAALVDPDQAKHVLLRADDICSLTGSAFLVVGSLGIHSTDPTTGEGLWTDATFNITTYDCAGKNFVAQPRPVAGSSSSWKFAINKAVDSAVTSYLLKLPGTGV